MIRDGAPATWTKDMVHVAKEIAAAADDIELDRLRAGEVAKSEVPIVGDFTRGGKWRDGLTERCRMSERGISRALTELGRADYEMRVRVGVTKDGKPVFAAKGNAVTFAVRYLPPRSKSQRPPGTTTFDEVSVGVSVENPVDSCQSPPSTATFDCQSPPSTAPKPAKYGDPDARASSRSNDGAPPGRAPSLSDDTRAAAAAAVARAFGWPPDHAERVAETILARKARSKDPVMNDPEKYVLGTVKKKPESWAPHASRWRPKDNAGKPAAAKPKASVPAPSAVTEVLRGERCEHQELIGRCALCRRGIPAKPVHVG